MSVSGKKKPAYSAFAVAHIQPHADIGFQSLPTQSRIHFYRCLRRLYIDIGNGFGIVGMTLPKGSDPTRDYAVISVRQDGSLEILGDLDPEPTTLTVDSSYYSLPYKL